MGANISTCRIMTFYSITVLKTAEKVRNFFFHRNSGYRKAIGSKESSKKKEKIESENKKEKIKKEKIKEEKIESVNKKEQVLSCFIP